MRKYKISNRLFLFFFLLSFAVYAFSQRAEMTVEGVVIDEQGEPLIGVSVRLQGTGGGVATSLDGNFRLGKVPVGATLLFSYLGFKPQEVTVKSDEKLRVVLRPDIEVLDEVVVVGYGSQKRNSVTGAISTVQSKELLKSPTGNLSTSVAGRIPGLLVKQPSGQPGNDEATLRIRGLSTYAGDNSPLVLVDGIERAYNQIDPEEVETFTILKDAASTAVYGVRGGNGVILVTTKRGKIGKPKVSYSGNFSIQTPTQLPKVANSYQYATYFNQAIKNDTPGAPDYYTQEELNKYQDGSDPILYPDMEWVYEVFERSAPQQKHNINVSGGTQFVKYYVSLGYFNQTGLQKNVSQAYNYDNKDSYNRVNLRSNVDMTISPTTQLGVTLGVNNGHKTRVPNHQLYYLTFCTPPNASPGYVDDKFVFLGGRFSDRNPVYELTRGLSDIYENHFDVTVELSQNLNFITSGLTAKGKVSYDDNYRQRNTREKNEQRFYASRQTIDGEEQIIYKPSGEIGELGGSSNDFENRSKRIYGEASLNYNRSFNKVHNVTGLLLMVAQKRHYGMPAPASVATGYIEYVGRAAYSYNEKYLAEFNIGINGSENFKEGQRYGTFPAVSAGWIPTKEDFVKNFISPSILSWTKFRVSYGEVGNDKNRALRFFYYPQAFNYVDQSFRFGESSRFYPGYVQGTQTNPNVTWETSSKQNYAVETRFFKDKLSLNFDYFIDKRRDILTELGTQPFQTGFPSGTYNIGKTENKGYEIEFAWNHTINDFSYYLKGNYSFARNKIIHMDEALDKENPNIWRTGRRVNEMFGYVQDGFFDSEEEIINSPSQFGVILTPGDVKYRDVNGDGKITIEDQVPLMNPNFPEVIYGVSGGISYKGFDMSFLFQGADKVTLPLGGNFKTPFGGMGTIMEHSFDAWSPTNIEGAKYPKLSVTNSQSQNGYDSTLWLLDASYLRLKNVEIGYTFNKKQLGAFKIISSFRIYANAQNVYTWDKLKGITDPENKADNGGIEYPLVKVFNFGLNVNF